MNTIHFGDSIFLVILLHSYSVPFLSPSTLLFLAMKGSLLSSQSSYLFSFTSLAGNTDHLCKCIPI